MTGKMRLPTAGNWNFRILSDNGVRVWIDDVVVLDDWTSGGQRSHPTLAYNNAVAGSLHRVRIDYFHATGVGAKFNLYATPPGGSETQAVAQYFNPSYGLTTSQTAYDAQLGNVTSTTSYSKPEYGLATTTTADPSGLNLQATAGFEASGSGFLRQTGRTLPGGTSQSYSYYGANDSVDNPCTAENDPAVQAGAIKGKTETDPDGSGPKQSRTTETVYNASGKVVATRFNGDPWTCVSYDSRGRQTGSIQPTVNGRSGRTITTQYAADGNPLKTRIVDSVAGTTESVIDMLGRTVSTKDVWGNDYALTYDDYGNVTQKTGPLGTETYTYDTLFRLTGYALNSTTYATLTYDNFGRVATVTYPEAKDAANNTLKLTQVKRDDIGRGAGVTYQTSDGKTFDESVVRSQLGKIMSATQAYDGQTLNSNFAYDTVGRLTSGTVGQTKFDYGYSAPDTTTCSANGANSVQANKNSNRTSYKITNTATNAVVTDDKLCYNYADQLTYDTDAAIGAPVYDDHGNTTSFGGNGTSLTFGYDANDNNIFVTQGTKRTEYVKAATGDVLRKKEFTSGQLTSSYRYAAGGAILQTCSLTDDNNCTTVDRYLTLPGNVSLTLSPTNPDTSKRVVYSLHNYHGDTALTLTNEGKTATSTNTLLAYGPFGEQLLAGTQGTTTVNALNATDTSMGWAADPARKQEGGYTTSFVQMGARVYIPSLGRFLQVDPVDGGTLNGYVYVADPINASDYNGKWGFGDLFSAIVNVVKAVIKAVVTPVATVVRAVVSAVSQPKATAASSSGGGGRTGGSATTASVSPSSRVKKQSFSTGVDSLYLKNTVKSYGNPGGPSGSASVSYCAVICGGVGMNSGHPSVNFGVGIEAGIGIAADLSPGAANTGLEFGLGCSASMIHFEIGTGGVNGGFNLPTAKAGCGIQGSFTW
jgi:RHS repeat-associated protein